MSKAERRRGFMCGVDFEYELSHAAGGNRVYGSVEDLKKHKKCWESCGIIMVEVVQKRWVVKQDLWKDVGDYSDDGLPEDV